MFIDFEELIQLYPDITRAEFNRFEFQARQAMRNECLTLDGVDKLTDYPPEDTEALKHCEAELIAIAKRVDLACAENRIASVNSGSESVTYVRGSKYDSAASDPVMMAKIFRETINTYLRGLVDSNGVNLLYKGVYPLV